ncbi:MAG: hypothetical protein A4E31_00588 [Methanomassiliicoccales archaeon PtaU1.Bin030]|nr:MAG: hypothetical protein A4E31_00588 [Methanomassiliicoccales archaeon PtaU1.Bin030]
MIGVSSAGRRPQAAVPAPKAITMAPKDANATIAEMMKRFHPPLASTLSSTSLRSIQRAPAALLLVRINLENDGGTGTLGNRDGSPVNKTSDRGKLAPPFH